MVTLSNGKRVANFSSPHSFTFTDGTVLPAVDEKTAQKLSITFVEKVDADGDVELDFILTDEVLREIAHWKRLWELKRIDVVFCPLPMITCMRNEGYVLKKTPFRTIRVEDRIKKLVSIEKQCL